MSVIAGVLEPDGRPVEEDTVVRMLDAMHARGGARCELWRNGGAVLGVSRQDWELTRGFSGPVGVLEHDGLLVAADASLYYQDDLRRAIVARGTVLRGDTPSHLILAAYQTWGDTCTEHLEGDYAFVVWNQSARRLFCARDFSGKRTLYYAEVGGGLTIASTVAGVLAHPRCPTELDLTVIGQTAAGLALTPSDTCYRAVRAVAEGCTLTWRPGEAARSARVWHPPAVRASSRLRFDEAGEQLRALLIAATAARVVPTGRTSVYLSGGWDSTTIFAAGQAALRDGGAAGEIRPVSISYPPDDPGHEDELISAVAAHWKVPVHWLAIRDIPLFDRDRERAAAREEPFGHPYEMWHRALARGARAVGAHVALDGIGGDQLFQVSDVYLADLMTHGRWIALMREWRAKRLTGSGFRNFFRLAIQPALSPGVLRVAAMLRGGRPLIGYLERQVPAWFRADFVRQYGLVERERGNAPPRRGRSSAAYETHWYLTYPYFARIFGCVSALNAEEGVETRSPLYDQRVIDFALARPRHERSRGLETKRLLRRSMRGLLPEHVLAPRQTRTGVTSGYFDRSMHEGFGQWMSAVLDRPVLEELGIVDGASLRKSIAEYGRHHDSNVGVRLYFTLQTELWLRARQRRDAGECSRREVCSVTG